MTTKKNPTAGMSQREIKQYKEEQTSKRKKITYTVVGVVCVVLAAILLIWNSGFFQSRSTAVTINNEKYTPNDVNYYYSSIANQVYTYAQYGLYNYDVSKDASEQMYDEEKGITFDQYFKDSAVESLKSVAALTSMAKDAGYSLSADGKATVDKYISDLKDTAKNYGYDGEGFVKAQYGPLMTIKNLKSILERDQLATEYYEYYTANVIEVTNDEINAYYADNAGQLDSFVYSFAYFNGTSTSTDASDEENAKALEEAKQLAEKLETELNNGTDFEKAAASICRDNDNYSANTTSYGMNIYYSFADYLKDNARKTGDVSITENGSNGYYVVQFIERTKDNVNTANVSIMTAPAKTNADGSTDDASREAAVMSLTAAIDGVSSIDSFKSASADFAVQDYNNCYIGRLTSTFGENVDNWVMDSSRIPGQFSVFEVNNTSINGAVAVYYVSEGAPYWQAVSDSSIRQEKANTWMTEISENLTVSTGSGMNNVG